MSSSLSLRHSHSPILTVWKIRSLRDKYPGDIYRGEFLNKYLESERQDIQYRGDSIPTLISDKRQTRCRLPIVYPPLMEHLM